MQLISLSSPKNGNEKAKRVESSFCRRSGQETGLFHVGLLLPTFSLFPCPTYAKKGHPSCSKMQDAIEMKSESLVRSGLVGSGNGGYESATMRQKQQLEVHSHGPAVLHLL